MLRAGRFLHLLVAHGGSRLLPKVNLPHAIDFGGHVTFNVLVTLRSMFRGEEDSLVQERREQVVRVHHLLVPNKEGGEI